LTSYYSNRIYDSVGIDDDNTRFGLNGGRSILDLIVSVSCALLIDRTGRRPLFLAATTGMLIFFACMTIIGNRYSVAPSNGLGIGFVVFQWMHGVSYALAYSGLLVGYTCEILPFKLRAKGLMIMNMTVQAALAINGQVNPIPMDGAWKGAEWKLYTVYTVWIAFELVVVYFFFVETRGPTLEEVAKIFDGKDAEVGQVKADGLATVDSNVGHEITDTEKQGYVSTVERRE
jgi:MFS family permease